jgi:hypothetical protein
MGLCRSEATPASYIYIGSGGPASHRNAEAAEEVEHRIVRPDVPRRLHTALHDIYRDPNVTQMLDQLPAPLTPRCIALQCSRMNCPYRCWVAPASPCGRAKSIVLLFFAPAVNGLIGGAVGGYKAGSVSRGLAAGVLPAIVVAAALWVILALFDAPILGFFGGVAVGLWALLSSLGLLLGAAVGGAIAPERPAASM